MLNVVNQLNFKPVDLSAVKSWGFLYQPPFKRGRAIVTDEIIMDHTWPIGIDVGALKEAAEKNPGGQLYAQLGGGEDLGSGFWTPVMIETDREYDETLSEVSDMFTLPSTSE